MTGKMRLRPARGGPDEPDDTPHRAAPDHRKEPAMTNDELLTDARKRLRRLQPRQADQAVQAGAILVDTRPEYQRRADGQVPGAIVIERNHLEWRLDPASPSKIPLAASHDITWIICCNEGYSSSLAAAALHALGLHQATDVIGGFQAWRAASLPVSSPDNRRTGPTPPWPAPSRQEPASGESRNPNEGGIIMTTVADWHTRALDATGRIVAAIPADRWQAATPCPEWDVHGLVNHLVSGNLWAAELGAGATIEGVGGRLDGDRLGAEAYAASASAASDVFRCPGTLDAPCAVSYGPVPGSVYAGHRFIDVLIHGWDLAMATGQDPTLDPALVDACWDEVEPQAEMLRSSGMFGGDIPVPRGADTQTRLLAVLGRSS